MNKKITLAIMALLCCTFIVNAQIKEGSILLGGGISYNNTSDNYTYPFALPESDKSNSEVVNISLGKALKENSVVGILLTYNNSTGKITSDDTLNSNNKTYIYSAEVFYRRYKKLAKNFYVFGEFGAGFDAEKIESGYASGNYPGYATNTSQSSEGFINFTPGVSYKILKKLLVELTIPNVAAINYTIVKSSQTNEKENVLSFNSDLSSFGVNSLLVRFSFIF